MTAGRWPHVKALFEQALDQPRDARPAWVDAASAGDAALAREVHALLAAHDTAGGFLEQPAALTVRDDEDAAGFDPGARIGPYVVIEEIGRGGMGIVYAARDERLGRTVALKLLPPAVAADPALRERFRREARAAAAIAHPNVATVHALEEFDGQLVIAAERVPGETLRRRLEAGPLDPDDARAIALPIARALAAAHAGGVIHRDLKPENVIVSPGGTVKVVDFGIARLADDAAAPRLTRDGAWVGTPAYMAPEQMHGGTVDARTDIYAFGRLLGELVGGPSLRGQQASLAAIAARCAQPAPAARYQTAAEVIDALERIHFEPATAESARWWWEFHQASTAIVYWMMTIPAWRARGLIGGGWGRAFFIVTLLAVIVAANLRLHYWFTSRFYPAELRWVRRRAGRWIRAADWVLVSALAAGGLVLSEQDAGLATLLLSVAAGATVVFLLVERATTRAAFRQPPDAGAKRV